MYRRTTDALYRLVKYDIRYVRSAMLDGVFPMTSHLQTPPLNFSSFFGSSSNTFITSNVSKCPQDNNLTICVHRKIHVQYEDLRSTLHPVRDYQSRQRTAVRVTMSLFELIRSRTQSRNRIGVRKGPYGQRSPRRPESCWVTHFGLF